MSATSLLALLLAAAAPSLDAAQQQQVRLYALDCGVLAVRDLGWFSDTGEYDGKPAEFVVPCFVIRHPKGVLLWDAGLDAARDARQPNNRVPTLLSQLSQIGLTAADINYAAVSHFHYDHVGRATLFPAATWILSAAEVDAANADPSEFNLSEAFRAMLKEVKQESIAGDYDVFGDGTVRILKAPGHTPGHQVLALKLQKSGA